MPAYIDTPVEAQREQSTINQSQADCQQYLHDGFVEYEPHILLQSENTQYPSFHIIFMCSSPARILLLLLLALHLHAQQSFFCDVPNCAVCSGYNFCGSCQNNFILSVNSTSGLTYCQAVSCNVSNCLSCLSDNLCEQCQEGFYMQPNGGCNTTQPAYYPCSVQNCITCTNGYNQACIRCAYGYNFQSPFCVQNIPKYDCLVAFSVDMCQLCDYSSQFVTPTFSCEYTYQSSTSPPCTTPNCELCQNGVCITCLPGYNLAQGACVSPACGIDNCLNCSNSTTCATCNNYFLLVGNTCQPISYGCSINNCLYCSDFQICAKCQPGYYLRQISVSSSDRLYLCAQYTLGDSNIEQLFPNCQQYGNLQQNYIVGASLEFGCILCDDGFINILGECVANLTITDNLCDVQNCLWCSYDNYCGQCQQGYFVYSNGVCTNEQRADSIIPNCLVLSLTSPYTACSICQPGYILDFRYCMPINQNVPCNLTGCLYCVQPNVCAQCQENYKPSTTLGVLTCALPCLKFYPTCTSCLDTYTCLLCPSGLINRQGSCTTPVCDSLCATCSSQSNCLKCKEGSFLTIQGSCCLLPTKTMKGCLVDTLNLLTDCTYECAQCEVGYFLEDGLCYQLPCSLPNCAYCEGSSACLVCQTGYNLVDSTCVAYTQPTGCPDLCVACGEDGMCTQCLNGYTIFEGQCVCPFQNCLQCMSDLFCIKCADPFVPEPFNNGGCVLKPVPNTLCTIPNCHQCSTANVCSFCTQGFSLDSKTNTCIQNSCDNILNCQLCNQRNTVCYFCSDGYIASGLFNGTCIQIPYPNYNCMAEHCLLCDSQDKQDCAICAQGYNLTADNSCQLLDCPVECSLCSQEGECIKCGNGYYLDDTNACVPASSSAQPCTIANCQVCASSWNPSTQQAYLTCEICSYGFRPNSVDSKSCVSQICYIPNCLFCKPTTSSSTTCAVCQQGYYLNSYSRCVKSLVSIPQCSHMSQCIRCAYDDSCSLCVDGYFLVSNTAEQRARLYTDQWQLSVCVTDYNCSAGCQLCSPSTNCIQCQSGYTLMESYSSNYCSQSGCGVNYCQLCQNSNQCSLCQAPYTVDLSGSVCGCMSQAFYEKLLGYGITNINSTLFQQICSPYYDVQYCSLCSITGSGCLQCYPGFILVQVQAKGTCQCSGSVVPYLTTLYQCSSCSVQYCSSCSETDYCALGACLFGLHTVNGLCQCINNFVLQIVDNIPTCVCPDGLVPLLNGSLCGCEGNYSQSDNGSCACPTGTVDIQGFCLPCEVDFCAACSSPSLCDSCQSPFQLSQSQQSCQCPSGTIPYYPDNTCYTCNIPNCFQCSADNTCISCQGEFILQGNGTAALCVCPNGLQTTDNNTCAECMIPDCLKCLTSQICEVCSLPFVVTATSNASTVCSCPATYVKSQAGACVCPVGYVHYSGMCYNCSAVSNCLYCSADNVCGLCQPTFLLASGSCACPSGMSVINGSCGCAYPQRYNANISACVACLTGCSQCSSNNVCVTCSQGYLLNTLNNTCYRCQYPCANCSQGQCSTCQPPYSPIPNNGICYTCLPINCIQCLSSSPNICQNCSYGYTPNANTGLCQPQCGSQICTSCTIANQSIICDTCASGYYLSSGSCIACPNAPYCSQCSNENPNICQVCSPGFFLDQDTGSCLSCPNNCLTCQLIVISMLQAELQCLTFKQSTKQFKIQIGQYSYPAVCDPGCTQCDPQNPASCLLCSSGFALDSQNACVPCPSSCRQCEIVSSDGETGIACLSCYSNGFLSGSGQCLQCNSTSNCLTCTEDDLNVCSSCPSGYHIANGLCVQGCPRNCQSCLSSDSGVVCQICASGFALNVNMTCVPCLSTCRTCASQAPGNCLSCGSGFYLNSAQKCQACSQPFCSECGLNGTCSECFAGYTLSSSLTCIANCQNPCATCSSSSPIVCTSCLAGYSFNQMISKCEPVTTCDGGCLVCPTNTIKSNGGCLKCLNSQCARCLPSSRSICTVCIDGMYLSSSSGSCQPCPAGCATCSSEQTCLTCSSGYTIVQEESENSVPTCTPCSSPCSQCINNPTTCLSCQKDYTLVGWKCITNFYFDVSLVLGVDESVFYDNYEAFLQVLADTLSTDGNIGNVAISSISPGSTVVSAQVLTESSPGSSAAKKQEKNLESLTAEGTPIAGMPVESGSVVAKGDDSSDDKTKKKSNLGLILGLCIPISIIVIAIVIFCLMKQQKGKEAATGISDGGMREQFQLQQTKI